VRLLDHLAEALEVLRLHPDLVELEHLVLRQQPQHQVLVAAVRRHDRHAQVGLPPPLVLEADLPVLREPVLRDVELRHDLDA